MFRSSFISYVKMSYKLNMVQNSKKITFCFNINEEEIKP